VPPVALVSPRTKAVGASLNVNVTVAFGLAGLTSELLMATVTVGSVVSICGPAWARPVSDRLALVPLPLSIVTPGGRLTDVAASAATLASVPATV
jgi:hypothetical protein